jgi:ribosomal protein S18 acetylase RimI-like enzyme
MEALTIRAAGPADADNLRAALVELQDHERRLHSTRLPGATIADAYLAWMQGRAAESGAVLVAEVDGAFVGFVAGWIEDANNLAETRDSNHFGFISDICVLPAYRGRRIAAELLGAMERRFRAVGVERVRLGVLADNIPARASYEFAGYAPYEIIYEKSVGRAERPQA